MVKKWGESICAVFIAPTDSLSEQVLPAFHRMIPPIAPSLASPAP